MGEIAHQLALISYTFVAFWKKTVVDLLILLDPALGPVPWLWLLNIISVYDLILSNCDVVSRGASLLSGDDTQACFGECLLVLHDYVVNLIFELMPGFQTQNFM